jgi:serine/threonine protein kinase
MKSCPACKTAFPSDYTLCPRDGTSLIMVGEWAEGTLVRGKYRIVAKVGQGGMGSVYKAMHARFKEVRAIKVISPELANDANFVRRFEQEAIITRKLQHPNAVRVEDIDEAEDGRPFIVMEYIEGRSLKDVIEQEAPMDVDRVCTIVRQAAAALDAAHALGLVHRDIKPANIALTRSTDESGATAEQVKVLDFGIAKLKEAQLVDSKASHLSHLTLTSTGVVIGTPAYMSPEQAKGMKGDQLDGRSDLYSLGIVMYQMLSGELPLKADSTIEQLMAHINTLPKPIREARPEVPDGVASAVMRCLEKQRELRPASGQALVRDVDRVAGLAPVLPATHLMLKEASLATVVSRRRADALAPVSTSPKGPLGLGLWAWAGITVVLLTGIALTWFLAKNGTGREGSLQTEPVARSSTAVRAELSQLPSKASPAPADAAPSQTALPRPDSPVKQKAASAPTSPARTIKPASPDDLSPHLSPAGAQSTLAGPTPPPTATVEVSNAPPNSEVPSGEATNTTIPTSNVPKPKGEPATSHSDSDVSKEISRKDGNSDEILRPHLSRSQVVANTAPDDTSASTFVDVDYWYGVARHTTGRLRVSAAGVVFEDYDGKYNFTLACSDVVKVEAYRFMFLGPKQPYFNVKTRTKNHQFLPHPSYQYPETLDGAVKQERDSIIETISKDCKVR